MSRQTESVCLQAPIPLLDLAQPTITFRKLPLPEMGLTFLPSQSLLPDSRKRGRATADIDGEHSCLQKKKRRLRLFLITSRLSPQFSHPATNIVDRGSSKIAVWAKQKAMGRNLLRKAAILNRIRRQAVSARGAVPRGRLLVEQEKEQRQLEMARLTFNYGSIDTYTHPVHLQPPSIPPSTAIRTGTVSGSPTRSLSTSPLTSRSPSPTSPAHTLLPTDNPPDPRSPNTAYALSPPRIHSTRSYEPHLPSPLGLSNYDAFDAEPSLTNDTSTADPYAHLDEDDEEDRFSYLWDEQDDEEGGRHDSPFSPSVLTNSSSTTAQTRMSQRLKTPPPPLVQTELSVADAILGTLDDADADADADSTWPSPFLCPTSTTTTAGASKAPTKASHGARPFLNPFDTEPLAVRYPGAPVETYVSRPVVETETETEAEKVLKTKLVPACMSPNFRAADADGWKE